MKKEKKQKIIIEIENQLKTALLGEVEFEGSQLDRYKKHGLNYLLSTLPKSSVIERKYIEKAYKDINESLKKLDIVLDTKKSKEFKRYLKNKRKEYKEYTESLF